MIKKIIIFLLLVVVIVLGIFLYHKLTYKPVEGSWSLYRIEGVAANPAIENGDLVNIEFLNNGKVRVTTLVTGANEMEHDQGKHEIKGNFGFLGTVLGITGLNVNSPMTYKINGEEMEVEYSGTKLYFRLVKNGAAPTPTGKWILKAISDETEDINGRIAADGKVQIEFAGGNKVKYTHDSATIELENNTVTSKLTGGVANIAFDLLNTYGAQMDVTATEAAYMYDTDVFCIQIGSKTLVFRQK